MRQYLDLIDRFRQCSRKYWLAGAICAVFLGAMSVQGQPTRRLIVGCDSSYPPYEFEDAQGRPAGFNVDLIHALASETGLVMDIRTGPFQDIRQGFENGQIDILAGWGFTEARARNYLFSVHLNQISWSLFIREDGPAFRSEADLAGLTIIAQRGDANYDYFVSRNHKVLGVTTPEEAFQALAAGRGDCAVVNKGVGLYILHRDGIRNIRRLDVNFLPLKYCIALRKGDEEILGRINEGIFVLKESGRYRELYDRHFAVLEQDEPAFIDWVKKAVVLLAPLGILFLAVFAWILSLRVQVRSKTRDLAASEKRFRSLFEDSPVAIMVEDFSAIHEHFESLRRNGISDFRAWWREHPEEIPVLAGKVRVISINNAGVATLGEERKEDILLQLPRYFTPEALKTFEEELIALASRKTRFHSEAKLKNARGDQVLCDLYVTVQPDCEHDLSRVLVSFVDITERRQAEAALRQTQKLESIGTLAGGIAHDFNNLLGAIMGQSFLALEKIPQEHPACEHIKKSLLATERGAGLTRQLLAYAGRGKFQVEVIDLNRLVEENMGMLSMSIPKNAKLEFEPCVPAPHLNGDVGQLQQVVMNLIINAGEAIGDTPGLVTVRTGRIDLAKDDVRYGRYADTVLAPGPYALLRVSDTGVGIRPENIERIFDPFFSTKFAGRGLGLAALLGIVRGHGGGIHIQSETGKGTAFEIVFPLVEPVTAPDRPVDRSAAIDGRGKTILVIDDESLILDLVSEILTGAGFSVITALNPLEGIDLFRQQGRDISLVILDYSMPAMNGKDAFEALAVIDPGVRVILCSGYSEDVTSAFFGPVRPVAFFQKPYLPASLLDTIGGLLPGGQRQRRVS